MLTSQSLRRNLYPLLKLLNDDGGYVEFAYKGEVLRLTLNKTGIKAPKKTLKQRRRLELSKRIVTRKCSDCGGLMINDVCMGASHAKKYS